MKGKVKIISNSEEIENNERLGINTPAKFGYNDIFFLIDDIDLAYLSLSNEMVLMIRGEAYVLQYDESIWLKIKHKFNT